MTGLNLSIGSLFAGIGGLELGLERAGVGHTVFQVEKDEYCRAVLAKHWPDATRYEDVKDVGRHNLPAVDVVCGGFPCQDISYAGAGAGLAGERSGLWYEFARIIRELGPRYVVVENVAALLDRGIGDVLGTLADCGYDAKWSCIRAYDVGAPHLRDRVFLVAYPAGFGLERRRAEAGRQARLPAQGLLRAEPDAHLADANGQRQLQPQGAVADERGRAGYGGRSRDVSDADRIEHESAPHAVRGTPSAQLRHDWTVEPDVGRVAHGVPAHLDGGRCGEEEHATEARTEGDRRCDGLPGMRRDGEAGAAPSGLHEARCRGGPVSAMSCEGGPAGRHSGDEGTADMRPLRDGVCPDSQQEALAVQSGVPLGRGSHQRAEEMGQDVWRVEPAVPRVAHGVPNRVDRLRALGNAVVPQVAEVVGRLIVEREARLASEAA